MMWPKSSPMKRVGRSGGGVEIRLFEALCKSHQGNESQGAAACTMPSMRQEYEAKCEKLRCISLEVHSA